jgi:NAD(P)-dependent dehydrogenase (short-subunit alcohol dehydrogenase family)
MANATQTHAIPSSIDQYLDLPDQSGRVALITGANSGLGYASAVALARKNARVIMACRNVEKGERAAADLLSLHPAASVTVMKLDLGNLRSVREFAAAVNESEPRLDILMNNAGLMIPPYGKTADGFELQFGTNHLGHFALTALLLPRLLETPNSRIVVVGSSSYQLNLGRINFDDLQSEQRYRPWRAYAQSKLANLLFMSELQRRLKASHSSAISLATQPGAAMTNLQGRSGGAGGGHSLSPSAVRAAKYQLFAATSLTVHGGDYIEPRFLLWGKVRHSKLNRYARDEATAARLWAVSEKLTGLHFTV